MTWRRFKRGLAGEPDPLEYQEKQLVLTKLKEQEFFKSAPADFIFATLSYAINYLDHQNSARN
ncbi:MAG: hypothetical protein EA343_22800 [Nodularia sp. (in: Bacteria)]|nr:MAG: hypothetical protein EA343_22800 [Nodularia sp. (in: cyanobacteria)]